MKSNHCILLVLCLCLFQNLVAISQNVTELDSLCDVFEKEIALRNSYLEKRKVGIDSLKQQLALYELQKDKVGIININRKIYEAYRSFQCDSAIVYMRKALKASEGDVSMQNVIHIYMIDYFSGLGMYMEASDVLSQIKRSQIASSDIRKYYDAVAHLYGELSNYTQDLTLKEYYHKKNDMYNDSVKSILSITDYDYLWQFENKLWYWNPQEALLINAKRMANMQENTSEYAIAAFMRGLEYMTNKDTINSCIWYLKSAIVDIRLGITDNASSWNVANCMFDLGKMEQAYLFVNYSMDNALFFNAPLRRAQISVSQAVIEKQYQFEIKQKNERLTKMIYLITFMALLAILSLIIIAYQMKKINKSRTRLKETNAQLDYLNKQLTLVNENLKETNDVKELYISHYMSVNSTYIDKLDGYRRMVRKKLMAKQFDELLHISESPEMMDNELQEFYANFDATFLTLYPNFVQQFNALLQDDAHFELKQGETMNTELRIFALIRLGINESSKIATFLRYSVNSIYNYRAKVKSKALNDRNEFENEVMKIGRE